MGYYQRPQDQPAWQVACPVCPAKPRTPCIGSVADFHYAREAVPAGRSP